MNYSVNRTLTNCIFLAFCYVFVLLEPYCLSSSRRRFMTVIKQPGKHQVDGQQKEDCFKILETSHGD